MEVGGSFLYLFLGSNSVIVCSGNSVCWGVKIFFASGVRPYLPTGPSTLCYLTCFFRILQRNLNFCETTSKQQCVLLQRHKISVHLNSSLKSPVFLLSCFLCLSQHTRTKIVLTAIIPALFCFQVAYSLRVVSRREQDLCPVPTPRIYFHHRLWWKSCNTLQELKILQRGEWRSRQWSIFCVQSELWRIQFHTKNVNMIKIL